MFKEILQRIVEQSNGVGAVLMGYDGIAVEQVLTDNQTVDSHLIAVEYANVLKELKKAASIMNAGDVEEVSINTGKFFVVLRLLTPEYFVALTLNKGGNLGKAKYLVLRETPTLQAELA